jgi:hypothetical protein
MNIKKLLAGMLVIVMAQTPSLPARTCAGTIRPEVAILQQTDAAVLYSGTCGANVTWALDDAGTLIISGTGNMHTYYSADATPWTEGLVRTVIVGEGVTSLSSWAFSGCNNLTDVTLPSTLTSIGYSAFENCPRLTEITIPSGVKTMGHSVFYDCIGLERITLPASLTTLGAWTFSGCVSLTTVTIPDGVQVIDDHTFNGCTIGVVYSEFILNSLPKGRFDKHCDVMLTEKGVKSIKKEK